MTQAYTHHTQRIPFFGGEVLVRQSYLSLLLAHSETGSQFNRQYKILTVIIPVTGITGPNMTHACTHSCNAICTVSTMQ